MLDPDLRHECFELRKISMPKMYSGHDALQARAGFFQRIRIAIDPNENAIWSGVMKDPGSEPCISKSAVHVNSTWFALQPEYDFVD